MAGRVQIAIIGLAAAALGAIAPVTAAGLAARAYSSSHIYSVADAPKTQPASVRVAELQKEASARAAAHKNGKAVHPELLEIELTQRTARFTRWCLPTRIDRTERCNSSMRVTPCAPSARAWAIAAACVASPPTSSALTPARGS